MLTKYYIGTSVVRYQEGMLKVGSEDWVPVLGADTISYRSGSDIKRKRYISGLINLPDSLYVFSQATRAELISLILKHEDSVVDNTTWVDRGNFWSNDSTGRLLRKRTGEFTDQIEDIPGKVVEDESLIPITFRGRTLIIGSKNVIVPVSGDAKEILKTLIRELELPSGFIDLRNSILKSNLKDRGYDLQVFI